MIDNAILYQVHSSKSFQSRSSVFFACNQIEKVFIILFQIELIVRGSDRVLAFPVSRIAVILDHHHHHHTCFAELIMMATVDLAD
jgi:hypothetical protein